MEKRNKLIQALFIFLILIALKNKGNIAVQNIVTFTYYNKHSKIGLLDTYLSFVCSVYIILIEVFMC